MTQLYNEHLDLVKCYKCEFYHIRDEKHIKEVGTGDAKKFLCNDCSNFDTRTKEELRIGASFDKTQAIIIKDLAYRVRLLELEKNGLLAKIERLESKKKQK